MRYSIVLIAAQVAVLTASHAGATDWISAPSYFTHDPQTGERVRQYAPIGPFYANADTSYTKSGYRHTRSSIQVGGNADHFHLVEEWGRPVRPYGEWRFPYRPYSVPYDQWGPPWAGFTNLWGGGVGPWGAGGGYGPGHGGGYGPGDGGDQLTPNYGPGQAPWWEGRYQEYHREGHNRFPPPRPPYPLMQPHGGAGGGPGGPTPSPLPSGP